MTLNEHHHVQDGRVVAAATAAAHLSVVSPVDVGAGARPVIGGGRSALADRWRHAPLLPARPWPSLLVDSDPVSMGKYGYERLS